MSQTFEVTGVLTDDRHVTLDRAIPLTGGKVRVTVEPIPTKPMADLAAFENDLRERQQARGHVPPTKDEIDAYLDALDNPGAKELKKFLRAEWRELSKPSFDHPDRGLTCRVYP